jgi:hypothetical protein
VKVESGSGGEGYGEQVAGELARLRDALDDLRRRPVALDADTLRHVVTASLSEVSAPPPNLLVTAIRRLDRLDARLESIEAALGAPSALPRPAASGATRGRAVAATAMPLPAPSQAADPEAIADALARRLAGMMSSRPAPPMAPATAPGPGITMDNLVRALRPLVPDAARSVLRRAGREPSPQAVEVLQQTALTAIEEAARSAGQSSAYGADPWTADPRPLSPPPQVQALSPAPAAAPPPPAPPIDVAELAAAIADQVAAAISAQLQAAPPLDEPVARQPEPAPPPPPAPPPLDPKDVADAVLSRLAQQPPPQAVVSAMAMAPLLSAVGNVEAAVARITDPSTVVGAVDRLEAGVEALAKALEDDRSQQADEVRRGFAELHELLQAGPLPPLDDEPEAALAYRSSSQADAAEGEALEGAGGMGAVRGAGADRLAAAVAGVQRRLDRLADQLEPLGEVDLAATVPELTLQGRRLERSLNHILTALAALAEHLSDQSTTWRGRFDELSTSVAAGAGSGAAAEDLGDLRRRIDELVAGLAADRQRFQRLGSTVNGLAELLGHVSSRLDRPPQDPGVEPGAGDDASSRPYEGVDREAPVVPWYEEEPDEPELQGRGGTSMWDTPEDEWKRMDLWGPRDDRVPAADDAGGDGVDAHAAPESAEPADAIDPPAPDGDAVDDQPPFGPGGSDGEAAADSGRRRRGRSRRGNRR